MRKQILSILIVLSLIFALSGCDTNANIEQNTNESESSTNVNTVPLKDSITYPHDILPLDNGNRIVIYNDENNKTGAYLLSEDGGKIIKDVELKDVPLTAVYRQFKNGFYVTDFRKNFCFIFDNDLNLMRKVNFQNDYGIDDAVFDIDDKGENLIISYTKTKENKNKNDFYFTVQIINLKNNTNRTIISRNTNDISKGELYGINDIYFCDDNESFIFTGYVRRDMGETMTKCLGLITIDGKVKNMEIYKDDDTEYYYKKYFCGVLKYDVGVEFGTHSTGEIEIIDGAFNKKTVKLENLDESMIAAISRNGKYVVTLLKVPNGDNLNLVFRVYDTASGKLKGKAQKLLDISKNPDGTDVLLDMCINNTGDKITAIIYDQNIDINVLQTFNL